MICKLDFKRIESVKAEKGYHGPALVCAIYFSPIAGYIPDRAAIKYLAAQRHMEVWLVPIAGTRVLVVRRRCRRRLAPRCSKPPISSPPPSRRESRRRIEGDASGAGLDLGSHTPPTSS